MATPNGYHELCNVEQQNAHLSNECFNSILDVFYMFRTLCVCQQEDVRNMVKTQRIEMKH